MRSPTDLGETPELGDSACGNRWTLYRGRARRRDRRDLAFETAAEGQPIAGGNHPRDHPDVRDLLAAPPAFDLEDRPRCRAIGIAFRCRQQLSDPGHKGLYARTSERRTEEDRVHERPHRLGCERVAKHVVRQIRLVLDVRGHDRLVAFREHLGQPSLEGGILRVREVEVGGARA
jgi:hypothetical protein